MLKELAGLSSNEARAKQASTPAILEPSPLPLIASGEPGAEFREMLHRRSTAPFVSAIPYHRWGINE